MTKRAALTRDIINNDNNAAAYINYFVNILSIRMTKSWYSVTQSIAVIKITIFFFFEIFTYRTNKGGLHLLKKKKNYIYLPQLLKRLNRTSVLTSGRKYFSDFNTPVLLLLTIQQSKTETFVPGIRTDQCYN